MIQIIVGAIALVLLLIVLAFLWTYFYYVLALVLGVVAVVGFLVALGCYKEYSNVSFCFRRDLL